MGALLQENNDVNTGKMEEIEKKYHALAMLTTNLLIISGLYTLFLNLIIWAVEDVGVSTVVDVMLLLIFALVTFNTLRKSGFPLHSFGITFENWRKDLREAILLTIPLLLFFLGLKLCLIMFIPQFEHIPLFDFKATFKEVGFTYNGFFIAVVIYIIFSFVQEFIARAGLQSAFVKFLPSSEGKKLKAILLSNLLFAMAHSHIGYLFALSSFLPGLYWGWMFSRQTSIVGVTVSHMLTGIWVIFVLGFTSFIQ